MPPPGAPRPRTRAPAATDPAPTSSAAARR